MTQTPEERIEELASDIKTIKELKALIYHQDYIFQETIQPELTKMESSGKKRTANAFIHYNTTYRKIIAYLWKEYMLAKNPEYEEVET